MAELVLLSAAIYAAIGLVVAVAFVWTGVGKVDHAAADAPWSFRLLIMPGVAALWPVMLMKWRRAVGGKP